MRRLRAWLGAWLQLRRQNRCNAFQCRRWRRGSVGGVIVRQCVDCGRCEQAVADGGWLYWQPFPETTVYGPLRTFDGEWD